MLNHSGMSHVATEQHDVERFEQVAGNSSSGQGTFVGGKFASDSS